ncbi:uncharacterized protein LOC109595675 [Aethina tumida]|uniref:uncharacterized protein LOC109595675 n=1 Tax=Aethina tumida TaxID=116153 RepID=UPI00214925C9|nr:uncharacterized protein LOC109595675 [Aethina tumida]
MAYKLFVFAAIVSFTNAHVLHGYSAPLPVAAYSTIVNTPAIEKTVVHHPDPIVSTRTIPVTIGSKVVAPAKTSVYSEEPNVHELSTFIRTAPGLTRTIVKHPAPIVNSRISYPAPVVHERIHHPAPLAVPAVQYGQPIAANALALAHGPITVPAQPALQYGQPLLANAAPVAPIVKTIAHEPSTSEYSTYTATAPAFTETRVIPQPAVVY